MVSQDKIEHAYGGFQFSQIAQIASLLTGHDLRYKVPAGVPDSTYFTLPGAMYLDFGIVLSLIVASFLGLTFGSGLFAATQGARSLLVLIAPLIFAIGVSGWVTSLVPNLWPCLAWIGVMFATEHIRPLLIKRNIR